MKKLILSIASGLALTAPTWALPTWQLDITGGVYDPVTETTVATTNPFDLVALYDTAHPETNPTNPVTAFISAAIIPKTNGGSFGFFTIDGVKYGDGGIALQLGTPPIDAAFPNLPPHGIFPTLYAEKAFSFSGPNSGSIAGYNTATGESVPGDTLLFKTFNIDVSGVDPGVVVHFDLYDEIIKTHPKDATDTDFAPFSHDAESGCHHNVPDGGATVMMLGAALAGLGSMRRFYVKR